MTKKKIIILLVIIALATGFISLYLIGGETPPEGKPPVSDEKQEELKIPQELLESLTKKGVVIKITPQGFDPKEVTLKKDQSISFVNTDSQTYKIFGNMVFTDGKEIKSLGVLSVVFTERLAKNSEILFWEDSKPEEKVIVKPITEPED